MRFPLRNNALPLLSILAFLATIVLVALVYEHAYFRNEKAELIRRNDAFRDLTFQKREFTALARFYLQLQARLENYRQTPPGSRQDIDRRLKALLGEIAEFERAVATARMRELWRLRQQAPPDAEPAEFQEVERAVQEQLARARALEQTLADQQDFPVYQEAMKMKRGLRDFLDQVVEDSFERNEPVLALEIVRNGEVLIERHHPNPSVFTAWSNSLLPLSFSREAELKIDDPADPDTVLGTLRFYYTSPVNFEPVRALTVRSRWILGGLLLCFTLAYLLILRFVILPLRDVTMAIQSSSGGQAVFLQRPYTRLERLYNRMARDAQLVRLRTVLDEGPGAGRLRSRLSDLEREMGRHVPPWFGFNRLDIHELERSEGGRLAPPRRGRGAAKTERRRGRKLQQFVGKHLDAFDENREPEVLRFDPGGEEILFLGALPSLDAERSLRLMILALDRRQEERRRDWYGETAQAVHRQLRSLIEQQIVQSRELFHEKSRANISLSRNLGHDLTNIIATNKLELLTLREILKLDPAQWSQRPRMLEVLGESLTRVLDNTRSLQEIVNLYRAYEYLGSPRYEPVNLAQLLREIVDIFRLSMSAAVSIDCDFDQRVPLLSLEPRLFKLAVFNLLTNSQDAIRRLPPAEQERGKIEVQTRWNDAKNTVSLRVSDNGPGIRTADGGLASPEQIQRIFELGYTTKAEGQGEGLGLNWVRNILTEFHSGRLHARNRTEGGAQFELLLEAATADWEPPSNGTTKRK